MEVLARAGQTACAPPSAAAISACRNLILEGMREVFDLASSYARSGEEASYRGDVATLKVHITQLRACVVELIALRNTLTAQGGKAETA